jgi:ABC-type bacteriocin/lantibiotic exporter with double-glycine peptidase domain
VSLLENSLVLTVVLLGAYLVAQGKMAGGDLTAFYFYSTTITAAMQVCSYAVLLSLGFPARA